MDKRKAVKRMLTNLSKEHFAEFCHELVNRKKEPRVALNKVEGKSFLEITAVLVSTFDETGAVEVAAELLNEIDEHFVDKHQIELINRVHCVADILDQLLGKKVIKQAIYDQIRKIPTTQEQMRELFSGPLNAAGLRGKEVFYRILEKEEKYLIDELKGKKFSMAANAILRRNKTSIVDTLCADYMLILNKADQNELITQREYKNLKSINQKDKEGHVVELLDKIMDKGEKTCLAFLNVLQTDEEIQKTYPELNNILKKENCPLPYLVQACSVDNTAAGPSAGGTAQYTMVDDEHFVDKHQIELINRVHCVADILDQLLGKKVIKQAIYDKIRKIPTTQEQMRELFSGPLNAAGLRGKEVFYRILEKEEKYLIDELKGKKFSMAANAILRRNKTSIVDTLCADYILILNKADQNELITQREYKNLKSINQKDKEGHVLELLDKIMDKGEKTCLAFLNVLQTDEEIQKTYPELNNILKKENCPLPYLVQACSVDNTVKDADVKCSEPGSSNTAGPSAGGTAQYTMVDGEHFVDKHQIGLINRVNCVADILDLLLDEKVITKPIYDEILEIPTNQKKMRKLLRGPLNEAGLRGKEVFYKFLEKEAKYLIDDLKQRKEPLPPLIQSVETMACVIELLLETLKYLSYQDLQRFQMVLNKIQSDKGYPNISPRWLMMSDRQDMVFSLVQDHSQHRLLEMTTEAFERMNRTDLVQRLSQSSSGPKKKHSEAQRPAVIQKMYSVDEHRPAHSEGMYSVDEHRPAQSEGAQIAAVKPILLKTLKDLSGDELDRFQWYLQFTYFQKSISYFCYGYPYWTESALRLVDQMVETCGPQSVEVTREVLMDMKTSDPKDSSGWNKLEPEVNSTDEDEPSTYSLKSEAGNFECSVSGLRWVCQEKVSFKYQFCSSEEPMKRMEMMKYMPAGPLIDITVISGKLFEVYLPHWICIELFVDKHRLALVQRVKNIEPILDGLFSYKVSIETIMRNPILHGRRGKRRISKALLRGHLRFCGPGEKEIFYKLLREHESDLLEDLADEETLRGTATCSDPETEKEILLKTLKDTSYDELHRFQWYLQFTYFQKSISCTFHGYPYWTAKALQLVDQMMETCGPQSVEVTREVLMDMDRSDLVERLSETILRLKDKHPSKPPKEEVTVASLEEKLLETLEDLSDGELENFNRGLQRISSQRLETVGSRQSMELTMEILKKMKEDDYDLEQMLSNITLGSKGPSRSLELEGSEKMTKDSSDWTKLEPEVNSTDEDEASTYRLKPDSANHLFVDKHRLALVQRVKNIEPILDGLFSYKVINRENYEEILSLHGRRGKMRALLSGPLRFCAPGGKEIFYKLLRKHESDLLDDLADESEKYKKNKKGMEVNELNQFKSLIELEESFPSILRGKLKVANTDKQ
ncbi:hypothetical protein F7725_018216 [Dissostichus mawsoni]|uniref:Uncharacterized protein n=1 Tax=Dissostichus mawsoni TaxID=36200 RepID=A0A7J5XSH8_DISMA|nr:hypothetical protein F7725_018216 [Dissostichus mawsoni]